MINVLGLALYGPKAASHRYRLSQYKEGLLDKDINLKVYHLLDDDYLESKFSKRPFSKIKLVLSVLKRLIVVFSSRKFDVTILHCELFPFLPAWLETFIIPKPYVFDFDDAWHLRYKLNRSKTFKFFLDNKIDKVIENASAVHAGNIYLSEYSLKHNDNIILFPTVLDTEVYKPNHVSDKNKFTIGWIGSPTTAPYLESLVNPLSELGKEGPVSFHVIGGKAPEILNIEIHEIPWSEVNEVDNINKFDVGVMPLINDEWAKGKCAFKLLQYMACGLPVVASNVGANIQVVDAETGFLVDNDDMWLESLRKLRDNPGLRSQLGSKGRAKVEESYSLHTNLPVLEKTIKELADHYS
jgi:glycosyltransferase involved in cell wall biosynthesis